ncbi:glycerophosphodiester phosphodiesterase family protein [Sporosarcina thermotolerans]|uniref:Glycerophosphodiester phosphodiesterase family protein n=2 Tax=Sporosarcina thermotolerans TaxID=633404 RepID=A0AAW9A7H0_9BACL|nr:glycerophosphodiester phosphodiesterase family protein [Sporosarcina thermotolerans]MDW0116915.1 glycerophosphodiester phosphodiesterase family protein [Sporosarcina thermotolerans]
MKKIIGICIALILLSACSLGSDWDNPMPEDGFIMIAHRGASAYEPENTLPSFELAEKLDADYIELDVHLTKDGELIVMHDDEVDRTTESMGKIKDYTLRELKELDANEEEGEIVAVTGRDKDAYEIPILSEVFDEMADDIHYVIELKDTEQYVGIEKKIIDLMKEYELISENSNGYPRAIIHSFDKEALKEVHRLNPAIPLLQLISFDEDEEAKIPKKELKDMLSYASGVGVSYEAITPSFVNKMHKEGLVVHAYTVDDAEAALRLKAMGVNGIHTNEPDLLDE